LYKDTCLALAVSTNKIKPIPAAHETNDIYNKTAYMDSYLSLKISLLLGIVAQTYNLSTQVAEEGELQV
jgi:hypothetical protein